jgi:hypothetical protein
MNRIHILKKTAAIGGHRWIYENLIEQLRNTDFATSAKHLDLALNDAGEAEIPFLGVTYLISNEGVRRSDGKGFKETIGSVLIHYILKGSSSRPAGNFITFAELAGPLFKQSSYSSSALERPIIKRFQGHVPELFEAAALYGGHEGGEAGLGSVSLIFELLPHIVLQIIFYDRDDEFPARATLLFDLNVTQLIDFEVLAVLVTEFIQTLINPIIDATQDDWTIVLQCNRSQGPYFHKAPKGEDRPHNQVMTAGLRSGRR